MSNVISARVSDEVLAAIDRLADSQERSRAWIAARLLETAVRKEIEALDFIKVGIDSADRGDVISQEEMEAWFEERSANRALAVAAE
jgi:predicted transcriptional regulator